MRPLSYTDAKVIIIYFSIADRKSFDKVESFWVPEILKATNGEVPFIVVGNKVDLRDDKKVSKPVTKLEAQALTKKIGGIAYRECSAKTQEGLGEVFQAAVCSVTHPDKLEYYQKKTKNVKKKGLFGFLKKK